MKLKSFLVYLSLFIKYIGILDYENTETERTETYTHSEDETDICKQPSVTGSCSDSITRWFYNSASNDCEPFDYSGCEGNGNNFDSKDDCENDCKVQSGNDYD